MANDKLEEAIRVVIETQGKEGVEQIRAEFLKLGTQSEKTAAETQQLVKAFDELAEQAEKAAKLTRLTQQLDETRLTMDKAVTKTVELREAITKLGVPTEKQAAQLAASEKQVAKLTTRYEKQATAVNSLEKELKDSGVDTKNLADENVRLEKALAGSTTDIAKQATALKRSKELAEQNARAYEAFAKKMKMLRDGANDVALRLTRIGVAAAASAAALATYGAARFFDSAIDDAAKFEAAIDGVGAVTGLAGKALDDLRETARRAALDTGRTFEESALALDTLARATGSADTATAALAQTLRLATVGQVDIQRAAEITTTTLTQFGYEATEAGRVADVLANTANVTAASVESVGNSLSYVAPLARQLGLDIEETAGYIAALAKEGFVGERAGTALRSVFTQLLNPASKFSKALREAKIDSSDFSKVLQELSKRGDEGRNILFKLGTETAPAIIALGRNGGASIRELTESMRDANGQVASLDKVIRDNLAGAFTDAGNAYDNLRIQLVKPLLDPLKEELQGLSQALLDFAESEEFASIQESLVTLFKESATAAKEFIGQIDFSTLAGDIRLFAKDASESLRKFGEDASLWINGLLGVVEALKAAFGSLQVAVGAIAVAMAGITAASADAIGSVVRLTGALENINPASKLLNKLLGVDIPAAAAKAAAVSQGLRDLTSDLADETVNQNDEMAEAVYRLAIRFGILKDDSQDAAAAVAAAGAATKQGAADAAQGADVLKASVDEFSKALTHAQELSGQAAADVTANVEQARVKLGELLTQAGETARAIQAAQKAGLDDGVLQDQLEALGKQISEQEKQLDVIPPKAAKAATEVKKVGDQVQQSAKKATDATKEVAASADAGGSAAGGYIDQLAKFISEFGSVSEEALDLFVKFQKGTVGVGRTLESSFAKLLLAANATREAIAAQQTQADSLSTMLSDLAKRGQEAGLAFQQYGQDGGDALRGMIAAIKDGSFSLNLLNQSDLDQLSATADQAAAKVAQIADNARDATRELEEMNRRLQDQQDQRLGNEEDIARREYEDQLRRIDELAARGGAAAAAAAAEARRLAEQEHFARLEEIRREKDARIQAQREANAPESYAPPDNSNGAGSGGGSRVGGGLGGGNGNGSGASGGGNTFASPLDGARVTVNVGNLIGTDLSRAGEDLARAVLEPLRRLTNLRGTT